MTRNGRDRTWHPAHPLCPNLGEEQGLDPPPVSPTLGPCASGVLSSIEEVFRVVEGNDDCGFGVRRQCRNNAR